MSGSGGAEGTADAVTAAASGGSEGLTPSERLSSLPKVTQLASGRSRVSSTNGCTFSIP